MTGMRGRYNPPSSTVTEQDFDSDLFQDLYLLKSSVAQRREAGWSTIMSRGQEMAQMTSHQFLSTLMGNPTPPFPPPPAPPGP